jgi:hypothetical protein
MQKDKELVPAYSPLGQNQTIHTVGDTSSVAAQSFQPKLPATPTAFCCCFRKQRLHGKDPSHGTEDRGDGCIDVQGGVGNWAVIFHVS